MLRKLVPYLLYSYVTFVGWTTRQVFFTWSHRTVEVDRLVQ